MNQSMYNLKNVILACIIAVLGIWAGGCAPATLSKLEKEGMAAYEAANYPAALEKWQTGLKQARELEENVFISQFLHHLGEAYDHLSEYQKALDAYQEALEVSRERRDKEREGKTLNNMCIVHLKLSRYQEALDMCRQALTLRRDLEDKQGESNTLDNIGIAHYRLGQFQEALDSYQQVLSLRRALDDIHGEGRTLNNIAGVYESQGRYQEALKTYQQALQIRQSLQDLSGKGKTLNNIASVSLKLGRYQDALENYEKVLEIKRESNDRIGEANALHNIGVAYWKLEKIREAQRSYQQALDIRRTIGDTRGEGSTLSNLGEVYEQQEDFTKALEHYRQALTIRQEIGDIRGEACTLSNLGEVSLKIGRYQEAYQVFEHSAGVHEKLGTRDNLWVAQHGLAVVEMMLEQPEAAIQSYERTLDTIESLRAGLTEKDYKLSFIQDKLYVYDELIDLLYTLHQQHSDRGYDRKALEIFERKQGRIFLEEMGRSGARLFAGLPETLARKELEIERQLAQARDRLSNERAVEIAKQNKKLLNELEEQENTLLSEQTALQEQLQHNYPDYYALKYPEPVPLTTLQQEVLHSDELMLVYSVMKEKTILWSICSNPDLSLPGEDCLQMYSLAVGEQELQKRVNEFRKAMQSEWRDELSYRKRKGREQKNMSLASETGTYRGVAIDLSRGMKEKKEDRPVFSQVSHDLYRSLFPEEIRFLLTSSSFASVLIVPTGPLHALPFEALASSLAAAPSQQEEKSDVSQPLWQKERPHYLVEDIPVTYLSSTSLLKTLRDTQARRRTTAPYPFLAFANPSYGTISSSLEKGQTREAIKPSPKEVGAEVSRDQSSTRAFGSNIFPKLPETAEEARAIKELLNAPEESEPLQLGEDASRARVFNFNSQSRLDEYRYLLFATHGVLPGEVEQVDQSALVLSDGFLTMADVFGLQLNAKLVSLSACNTGRGTQVKGEGVMGLTRAFMYAGTPTVAVTLWSVESLSAKDLDVGFFRYLKEGQAAARALQSIKVDMLRGEGSTQYQHPYYWAPFVVFGDGQ
ncbi:MAG: CHAT domain-containing protein [bacterium]|nr:CHAT domain-containing protein [bacterium]